MTRRNFLAALAAPTPRPLNVVLILADDLGWADTTPYGADLHETPHLEALARSGARFTQALSAAPVCSPTRAAIMSGKHPARLGITIWREGSLEPPTNRKLLPAPSNADLPLSEVTLAEVFRHAGYFTAHIGKWHLGDATHYPETQGFDVNVGGTLWGAPQTFFYPYRGERIPNREYRYVPHLEYGQPGEYLTDRLTTEALRAIDHAGARPFFLNLWFHNPHTPIEAKPELVDHYRRKLRPSLRHRNATYAAMVHSLDENVGRVMAHLRARGLERNTVVVFTSDNGGYINPFRGETVTDNYPLRSGKGSLYEGGLRVPLIIAGPGVTSGLTSPEPVVSHDLYPSLIELAGLAPPSPAPSLDGVSLAPLVREARARLPREELCFHYPHYYPTTTPVSAIRTRRWKLLEYFEDQHVELYDLSRDPGEATDLAAREPATARELRRRLDAWRQEVGARLPSVNPNPAP